MERKKVKVQLKRNGRIIEVWEGGNTHQAAIGGKGGWQLPGAAPLPKPEPQARQATPPPPQKKRSAEPVAANTIPVPPLPAKSATEHLEPRRAEFGKFPPLSQLKGPEDKQPELGTEIPAAETKAAEAPVKVEKPKSTKKQGGDNAKN